MLALSVERETLSCMRQKMPAESNSTFSSYILRILLSNELQWYKSSQSNHLLRNCAATRLARFSF